MNRATRTLATYQVAQRSAPRHLHRSRLSTQFTPSSRRAPAAARTRPAPPGSRSRCIGHSRNCAGSYRLLRPRREHGEFFTVLERSWRRGGARSPFPSTRPAARSRARFARTRLRPRLPHSPPWRRAKASRKSSDPCFRRSRRLDGRSRQRKAAESFLEGLRRPRPGFRSIRSRSQIVGPQAGAPMQAAGTVEQTVGLGRTP